MRLWIDTDAGDNPDDAVALLLALAHPAVQLLGVSTVSGDVERRAVFVRQLLAAEIDVVAGSAGLADALHAARAEAMLAIGPLTNLAALVRADASLPPRLVAMGGLLAPLRHRGAVRREETNFGGDVEAARLVLSRHEGATIVPLDVTARMVLDGGEREALVARRPVLGPHLEAWTSRTGAPVCLHDPLAFLVLVGDAVVRERRVAVRVGHGGRLEVGGGGPEHVVVVDAAVEAAKRRVLELLGA